ncbi:DUF1501 domain-containing protein [Aeromicrobium sp. UC242_57]|uniref:DUF1501 domain-containing protein n=1 Tax=Aeromicrobium sp. UC242_57 TaxID=3374624 RepID=UPI0037B77AC4
MTAPQECCADYEVSRRSVLKAAGLAGMAGVVTSMFGDVMTSTVFGSGESNILVVVSLRGGADGLSMVVPHAEPAYYAARPTTAIAPSRLLFPDATFGLHPAFAALSPAWLLGQVAVVHATGMAVPNRSHFEAMEAVEDADPGTAARVGWLNRMIGGLATSPDLFDGVSLGNAIMPTALQGPSPALATEEFASLRGPFATDPVLRKRITDSLHTQYRKHGGLVGRAGVGALALTQRASAIAGTIDDGPHSGALYPKDSSLSEALKTTAGLIRAGVGVKAVAVDSGGWDQHVELGYRVDMTIKDLAKSLAAFFVDLGPHAGRVTVVTVSEFGRRLQENGAGGVDHGYGNMMLVMGGGVKGGRYYSRWPGLSAGKQVDGDLAVTTDYRSVLAEILRSRFSALNTSKIFPGLSYDPLGFMS